MGENKFGANIFFLLVAMRRMYKHIILTWDYIFVGIIYTESAVTTVLP